MKLKVLGAGSIGNHLSHAARRMGWSVDLVDTDAAALARTRDQIYPSRYGQFDSAIRLFEAKDAPRGGYDVICIGTPPDSHIPLARAALAESPRAIVIEKPVCGPDMAGAAELADEALAAGVAVFVGYDHVVGRASGFVGETLVTGDFGRITTLDVEFREHWAGIFSAHPWLAGPWETYLGYSRRGGGASGEHSHAVNLWQHFAHLCGAGRVIEVQATLDIINDGRVDYDRLCLMNLRTEKGLVGRCVQDVVTRPPRKWARIQGETGHLEWWCGREPGVDAVSGERDGTAIAQQFTKTRPDDFVEELKHIATALEMKAANSPISLARGLDTMLVIAAAHLSNESGRRVAIDYSKGWTRAALSTR